MQSSDKQMPLVGKNALSPSIPHTGRAFGPGAGLMNRGKAPTT